MDIKDRINRMMVEAKRHNFKFTHLVVGKKEYKEIKNMDTSWMTDEDREAIKKTVDNEWTLKIINTDEDEGMQICNVFDKEQEVERRMKELTKETKAEEK